MGKGPLAHAVIDSNDKVSHSLAKGSPPSGLEQWLTVPMSTFVFYFWPTLYNPCRLCYLFLLSWLLWAASSAGPFTMWGWLVGRLAPLGHKYVYQQWFRMRDPKTEASQMLHGPREKVARVCKLLLRLNGPVSVLLGQGLPRGDACPLCEDAFAEGVPSGNPGERQEERDARLGQQPRLPGAGQKSPAWRLQREGCMSVYWGFLFGLIEDAYFPV